MEVDPLQTALEGSLHGFLTNNYDEMVKNGCTSALSAYRAAVDTDRLLQHAFENMVAAHNGLTETELASFKLIDARIAQAVAEGALFLATAPIAEAQLAAIGASALASPEVKDLAKNIGNTIAAVSKDVGQYRGALVSGFVGETPISDVIDTFLNAWGTVTAAVSVAVKDYPKLAVGSLKVGAIGQALGAAKTLYDITQDFKQLDSDADAHVKAEQEAYRQYSGLVSRLKANVTAMNTAVADCKRKQQPPTTQTQPTAPSGLGPIPSAGAQSRCAALSGPQIIAVGSVVTFRAGPGHPEACFGGPITWSWNGGTAAAPVLIQGSKAIVSGCGPSDAACVVRMGLYPSVRVSAGAHVPGYPPNYVPAYYETCINGTGAVGGWSSCLYYAIVGAGPTSTGLRIVTTTLRDATVGKPYSVLLQATGGKYPYVWGWRGVLPKGLVLDGATGVISGTPLRAGNAVLRVRVEDSSSKTETATANVHLRIR